MKLQNRIQQLSSFFLILLFSLQAGVGLWLHTSLHQHNFIVAKVKLGKVAGPNFHEQTVVDYSCSCLDFLATNLTVQDVITIPASPIKYFAKQVQISANPIVQALYTFRPLRAPPTFLS